MNIRYFLGLFLLTLIPLVQTALTHTMSVFFNFNSVIIALVFLLMLTRAQTSLYFMFVSGLILDIHAYTVFGSFLFAIIGTAMVVQALHLNFFTNRSLYSLVLLMLIATAVFHVLFIGVISLWYGLGWSNSMIGLGYWKLILSNIISHTMIAVGLFVIINRYSNSFKPMFLQS